MAIPLAPGEVYQVTMAMRCNSQNGLMVSHWVVLSTAGTGATDTQFGIKLDDAVAIPWLAISSDRSAWYGTRVKRLTPTLAAPNYISSQQAQGDQDVDPLPGACCGLVTLRTARAGRKGRGRKYFPFPTEIQNELAGVPSAAYKTFLGNMGTILSSIIVPGTTPNTATLAPVIWHRTTSTYDQVNDYLVRTNWATQIRRSGIRRPDAPPW